MNEAPPIPARFGDHDPFRFCSYCGVDCYDEPVAERIYNEYVEHADDCPTNTGLFPVREEDLYDPGPPCDNCGHRNFHGMKCAECHVDLTVGDFYAMQSTDADVVKVIVCIGCQILVPHRSIDDDPAEGRGERP